jgi:uncharacterized protein with HEPN domain
MTTPREHVDYLQDIVDMLTKVEQFTTSMTFEEFKSDDKTIFAVVRALEIVGEATKHIPVAVRNRHPDLPWRNMAGMRDKLIHDYLDVDLDIVWKTATELIPLLKPQVAEVIEAESKQQ